MGGGRNGKTTTVEESMSSSLRKTHESIAAQNLICNSAPKGSYFKKVLLWV